MRATASSPRSLTARSAPLVLCDGAGLTFGSGRTAVVAVHGVTCQIGPGQHVALTGPSGSGKSTLVHLMAGLVAPTVGSVTWPGIGDRSELRPGAVAVIFQGASLLPALDVADNVALALILAGVDDRQARQQALTSLERLDLDTLAGALPDELSGGQAQRVAVARALAGSPTLILADEPTGQLDHATGATVINALLDAARHSGAALLVSTHDQSVAALLDDRWHMVDGRVDGQVVDEPGANGEGASTCSA